MEERGILYFVSSNRHIAEECIYSARTVKKYNPGLSIQVVSSLPGSVFDPKFFDFVDQPAVNGHPLKTKVRALQQSRFKKTVFLDADTEVKHDLTELFVLLESFSFLFTYDNLCDWNAQPPRFLAQESADVNTGFLGFDDNAALRALFTEWDTALSLQDETNMRPGHNCDQVYFNRILKDKLINQPKIAAHKLDNAVYNVRPWCWDHLKKHGKFSKARVLHAHHLHHGFLTKLVRKIRSL